MPFLGIHSWRKQFFDQFPVPEGVVIPLDDASAYKQFPKHRWIYNKVSICETQNVAHGLHGIVPEHYPVFAKPAYNLKGMGTDSTKINTEAELNKIMGPGMMWMELFEGEHISTDLAVRNGEVLWRCHTLGVPAGEGTFDYWHVYYPVSQDLDQNLTSWVSKNMAGFYGVMNIETIGGGIIEAHLRMGSQFLDLYPENWLGAAINVYSDKDWSLADDKETEGFSLPIVIPHDMKFVANEERALEIAQQYPSFKSLQLRSTSSDQDDKNVQHPPGGKVMGFINLLDLDEGQALRKALIDEFS